MPPRPTLISHRGDNRNAPENTLEAFRLATELPVDYIELDYYHSADGVPVVFHDKTLEKKSNAAELWGQERLAVGDRSWAELQQLDVGGWFGPQFADMRMCRLEEALRLICSKKHCMIERKAGDAETCVRVVEKTGVVERMLVMAFDWKFLAELHALRPNWPLGALGKGELTEEVCQEIASMGAIYVGWRHDDVTEHGIERAHGHGLTVWSYTINDIDQSRRLVSWGLDGIITDIAGPMCEAWRA